MKVRPYDPSDQDFLLSLVPRFSAFPLPAWRDQAQLDSTNRGILRRAIEECPSDSAILVAEMPDGTPAGFVHLQTQTDYFTGEKHGYISDLAVIEACEGLGIGRALIRAAEDWSRSMGYRLLALYVFSNNLRAQKRYEREGFAPEVVKYVKTI